MNTTPNYGALLQKLWTPHTSPIPEESNQAALSDPPADISEFLGENLLWQQTLPTQEPDYREVPTNLPSELVEALNTQGIIQLYSHQRTSLKALRLGKDVILTTNTASGKTLSVYLPILEGCIRHNHRALAFYGLKALALDQFNKLSSLLQAIPKPKKPILAMLTGDSKPEEREQILNAYPHIIGATPELIHYQLKTAWKSEGWKNFYCTLKYILIDEAHTLTGSYGASMALLLRRIKLAVDHFGGNSQELQFIFLSATCGNPIELARQLSGRKPSKRHPKPLMWIHKSGATTCEKQLIVTKPTHNVNSDTAKLLLYLLSSGKSGICFCNSRQTLKKILQLFKAEAIQHGYPHLAQQVAVFYGSVSAERRTQIIQQVSTGTIKWIISTEALEAGIDLPELECCILRGWPGSLMAFRQRAGRVGRASAGTIIFMPLAQSSIDCYWSEHPELLLAGEPEKVSFNENYPILLAKHLLCAANESNIPPDKISHYFGTQAAQVAQTLLEEGLLQRGKKGLWAKGFPHKDINFRGGVSQGSIQLIDADSAEEIEQMSEEIAYREVYPGAIYRCQDPNGEMATYKSLALDTNTHQATLQRLPDTPLFTRAYAHTEIQLQNLLTPPVEIPLQFSEPMQQSFELQTEPTLLKLELAFGTIREQVTGYEVLTSEYQRTCLHRKCLQYKQPLTQTVCLSCGKKTREAEIVQHVSETGLEHPYQTEFSTPLVKVTLNQIAQTYIQQYTKETKLRLSRSGQPIPQALLGLWEYPGTFIALHSFGHLLMAALPLVVRASYQDINYLVEKQGENFYGVFFDSAEGGNGASEAIYTHLPQVAATAVELAGGCSCQDGCVRCLVQQGFPQGNKGLVKQVGMLLLEGVVKTAD